MLLRQPHRTNLLAGKLAALLASAATVIAGAEAVTCIAAKAPALSQNIDTVAWTSVQALGHAVADYGAAMFWVTGYAVLGAMVAVLTRSVPVARAIGIAWAGPFEHLLPDGWSTARRRVLRPSRRQWVRAIPVRLLPTLVAILGTSRRASGSR